MCKKPMIVFAYHSISDKKSRSHQCDKMLKEKVAQVFPKVAQNSRGSFF